MASVTETESSSSMSPILHRRKRVSSSSAMASVTETESSSSMSPILHRRKRVSSSSAMASVTETESSSSMSPILHRRKRVSSSSSSASSPSWWSSSWWSSSSSLYSPRRYEEKEKDLGKSVCFWALNSREETEWYAFRLSNDDDVIMHTDRNNKKRALNKYIKRHPLTNGVELVCRLRHSHSHGETNKSSREILTPFAVNNDVIPDRRNCVAMGSAIYRLGGIGRSHNKVGCFDLSFPEIGWTNCPPMINRRRGARAVALDGKLYVMGGGETEELVSWAEVYDPCIGQWKELPPPSRAPGVYYGAHCVCAAIEASKKVMVTFAESLVLYFYDARTNCWAKHYGMCTYHSPATVVDHTVYWLRGCKLKAFDSDRNLWFEGSIDGLEEEYFVKDSCHARLLHIGGDKFCVFWVDYGNHPPNAHCVKIRVVSKCDGSRGEDGTLNAFIESCQSYHFDHRIKYLDSLMLDGQFNGGESW